MLGRRAREEGCARVCMARVAVRREVRAVAGKRGLPRGRAPGFMCNAAAEFFTFCRSNTPPLTSKVPPGACFPHNSDGPMVRWLVGGGVVDSGTHTGTPRAAQYCNTVLYCNS